MLPLFYNHSLMLEVKKKSFMVRGANYRLMDIHDYGHDSYRKNIT